MAKRLTKKSRRLFKKAKNFFVGGVNSPVRSFKSVGGCPVFMQRGSGSKLYSADGKEYIDYCLSWGALILGHAYPAVKAKLRNVINNGTSFGTPTELETELAEKICEGLSSIEKIRFVNSGTEAVMAAIRLARAFTKRNKIIRFSGAYHGHADYLLECLGIPKDFTKHTLVASYNDIKGVDCLIKEHKSDIAAIIVEPVTANYGVVLPREGFLQELRKLADKYDIVLIFDEVITGFRVSYAGAQGYFDVTPDLTCLGKIVGGGLPVGAFGGKKEIMELLAPKGNVYVAGTFSGNPLTASAGITTLKILKDSNPYPELERLTNRLCQEMRLTADKYGVELKVNQIASMFSIFFTKGEVIDYNSACLQDTSLFKKLFHSLLKERIYLSPSGFEANFLSSAHTEKDVEKTLSVFDEAFKALRRK